MLKVVQKGAHYIFHMQEVFFMPGQAWGCSTALEQTAVTHPWALAGRSLSFTLRNLVHYFNRFTALNTHLTAPSTDAHLGNDL